MPSKVFYILIHQYGFLPSFFLYKEKSRHRPLCLFNLHCIIHRRCYLLQNTESGYNQSYDVCLVLEVERKLQCIIYSHSILIIIHRNRTKLKRWNEIESEDEGKKYQKYFIKYLHFNVDLLHDACESICTFFFFVVFNKFSSICQIFIYTFSFHVLTSSYVFKSTFDWNKLSW